MSFKDVLISLTTYPERPQLEHRRCGSVDERSRRSRLGHRLGSQSARGWKPTGHRTANVPAMVAAELRKSTANGQDVLAEFQDAAERNNIPHRGRNNCQNCSILSLPEYKWNRKNLHRHRTICVRTKGKRAFI